MDEADLAQRHEDAHRDRALARHKGALGGKPLRDCCDCGEEIPNERRRAVPNARRCVDCQRLFENQFRRMRG